LDKHLKNAAENIAQEIARCGVMSFARFMELALYCPDCGYYEKDKDIVGRRGDFYTSVSTGSLFGELLAFQFAEWLDAEAKGDGVIIRIVEAGAHDGQLAADILTWMRDRRNETFARLEYWIVEPSARRGDWQRERLVQFGKVVRWVPQIMELETLLKSAPAIIFSNELLDAMPARPVYWDVTEKKWFERGVVVEAGRFVWRRMAENPGNALRFTFHNLDLEKLQDVLPDGFTTEINSSAEKWWGQAGKILKRGKLLTIDYGLSAEEFFVPERGEGNLRAYRQHHSISDILSSPGEQDITGHVNFSAIQRAGEMEGLRTEALVSQEKFLTAIAERALRRSNVFGEWNSVRTRQFQTLTHPEHLGRPFRVLIQSPQSGDSIS
jgi:SAM-dependent MidA family methyltransferase